MSKSTKPSKKRDKKIRYRVGDILEVETFAGPKIYKKVKKKINTTSEYTTLGKITVNGFEGAFVRRTDLYALKKQCVGYTGKEVLSKTISFTYDWQIIRVVKKALKKGVKNA
jgi:hypothetical protein